MQDITKKFWLEKFDCFSISGKDLKEKFKSMTNVQYQPDIKQAIKSIDLKEGDLLLITGSLYGAAEVLNLN